MTRDIIAIGASAVGVEVLLAPAAKLPSVCERAELIRQIALHAALPSRDEDVGKDQPLGS